MSELLPNQTQLRAPTENSARRVSYGGDMRDERGTQGNKEYPRPAIARRRRAHRSLEVAGAPPKFRTASTMKMAHAPIMLMRRIAARRCFTVTRAVPHERDILANATLAPASLKIYPLI